MGTAKSPHRSIAILKLPRSVSALVTYAEGVVTGMTNNPAFPAPIPPLAAITAAIDGLQTAETAALTRVKGAAATRNEKRVVLVHQLEQLRAYVQAAADASPENGASIIESARLSVKRTVARGPRVFAAKQGALSGEVKLVAPSAGHRASYEWEHSIDGGKIWIAMPPTLQARTSLDGLTPGSSVQFRYRAVTKSGVSDWSQSITLPLVK